MRAAALLILIIPMLSGCVESYNELAPDSVIPKGIAADPRVKDAKNLRIEFESHTGDRVIAKVSSPKIRTLKLHGSIEFEGGRNPGVVPSFVVIMKFNGVPDRYEVVVEKLPFIRVIPYGERYKPISDERDNPPVAKPIPNEPGMVYSPYRNASTPNHGGVDVHRLHSGAKAQCPYTGKIFLVP